MEQPNSTVAGSEKKVNEIIDILLKLIALAALFISCYFIIKPFVDLMVWAVVLAIALNPVFEQLKKLFRGKVILAASSITLLMLVLLIAPIVWMSISTGLSLESLRQQAQTGELVIPPPDVSLKSIPVAGDWLYDTWLLASTNMEQLILQYKTQLIVVGTVVAGLIASVGKGILLLALAIMVSGVLMAFGKQAGNFGLSFFIRLAGDRGIEIASIAEHTVRSVTRGILGVAFIQSMLAGIGMFVAGIPLAGLWTLLCIVLAVVQIGLLPVTAGVIIYAWMHLSTMTAVLLTVWMLFVGIADNILKPFLLGRKMPVPTLVVILGSMGGFIYSGFIGLFTGAIILSLGYKLMIIWIYGSEGNEVHD